MGWLYNRYRFCRGRDWFFGGICCRGLCDLVDWNTKTISSAFFLASSRSLRPRGLKFRCPDYTAFSDMVEVFATSWIEIYRKKGQTIWKARRGLCDLVDWNVIIPKLNITAFVEVFATSWIEITDFLEKSEESNVEVFATSWIEMQSNNYENSGLRSRSLRPRGLKCFTVSVSAQ